MTVEFVAGMPLPLEGLLVVALEQAVAAPMASCRLADAGARVIKIERPEGDFARGYDSLVHGECSYFVWLNRGKKSVVVDAATAEGKARLTALVAGADVFLQNLKPGAAARLGVGPEELRLKHPRLICCSISGYGDEGPLADRKAYDLLIQAESGLISVTGSEAEPSRVGISIADIATGMYAMTGIMGALFERNRTGKGRRVETSMLESTIAFAPDALTPLGGYPGNEEAAVKAFGTLNLKIQKLLHLS